MSEAKVIPMPVREPKAADKVPSIDTLLSDDQQLDALSDESIQRRSDTDRRKIAFYYLFRNLRLSSADPKHKSVAWIAKRVGISERQLGRWQKERSWPSLVDDVLSACYAGDLGREEVKLLKGLWALHDDEKSSRSVRLSALKEISRILGSSNTADKRTAHKRATHKQKADPGEASQRREELLGKIGKQIALATEEAGDPDASPGPSEPEKLIASVETDVATDGPDASPSPSEPEKPTPVEPPGSIYEEANP